MTDESPKRKRRWAELDPVWDPCPDTPLEAALWKARKRLLDAEETCNYRRQRVAAVEARLESRSQRKLREAMRSRGLSADDVARMIDGGQAKA